jgi:outer membrane biosynthesis protein TonB
MINKDKFITALTIVLLVVIGGAFVLAEKALPGDTLYGVKTQIAEPIAGMFAFTKEAKAEWQKKLAERRLEETQKLIAMGILKEPNTTNATANQTPENSKNPKNTDTTSASKPAPKPTPEPAKPAVTAPAPTPNPPINNRINIRRDESDDD